MTAKTSIHSTDVLVIGWGLSGLVAAAEAAAAGKRVIVVDQEPRTNLGGQAWWSFGGLFLVDSPEQRRMGIRDSYDLARQDWLGNAGFDREEDAWPRRWAEAYLQFAAGEKRSWLRERGVGFFPIVGWAERGGYGALGPGNSVPRFHITWGTGPGIVAPFQSAVEQAEKSGRLTVLPRHRVTALVTQDGVVTGAQGEILASSAAARGEQSSREPIGAFEITAGATIVTSGGIGGNHELVRAAWPERLGTPPADMLTGVPGVRGRIHAGGRLRGGRPPHQRRPDVALRRGHPQLGSGVAGSRHPDPARPFLALAGRDRAPPARAAVPRLRHARHPRAPAHDRARPLLVRHHAADRGEGVRPLRQRAEPRSHRQGRAAAGALPARQGAHRPGAGVPRSRRGLRRRRRTWARLIARMRELPGGEALDPDRVREEVVARDRELDNDFTKDAQIAMLRSARAYRGDRLIRTATPHRLQDPSAGPMVAVRLRVITRKSLGGMETDLDGRALSADGAVVPGLYAAGEASGFGGGGVHGYRALEGTFLGGCLFSGRQAGRAAAQAG